MILGVILAILGSTFVIYSPMTENKLLGILLVILTTIFSGAYMVYTKKFLNTVNSLELTTYVSLICSITLFGISFFSGTFVILTDLSTLLYVLILAFFSTVIGLLGFMKAISYLDVGLVSIINLIEPFFTVIISYILFKDTLTLLQLIGGFIIVLGVYFYEK
ncbi:DMT family transporter [Cetobacterium sp.]|uniref:DMT family transporter n=1 Tax=Cetobacterium sp. TaxID=2071632 RepID=UPI003AF10B38